MNGRLNPPESLAWQSVVPRGAHWSGVLRRGMTLRLVDTEGGANVSALFYNFEDTAERYNMPDTLKAQHTAYLTAGCVCYSDMGRVLCAIVQDSVGWHDTLCGVSTSTSVTAKYGATRFQEQRNDRYLNGYDSLLNEAAKYGMSRRDLGATVNFFSKVTVNDDGSLQFHAAHSAAGAFVDLRFEMHTLVILSACQHPLDPQKQYAPGTVGLKAWHTGTGPKNDPCRLRCPENGRGYENTERLFE